MAFWVIAALLTLAASLAVLLPLSRKGIDDASAASAHDLEVYRDQLREIERDERQGRIATSEAAEARAEVARRVLKAEAERATTGKRRDTRLAAAAGVLAVPLIAWSIYAATGSPHLPGQPLAERLSKSPAESTVEELVARAEAHLAANPQDARGWDVLAPIYLRIGRQADSVTAFRNAIRLGGSNLPREAGLGEAIAAAAGGAVTAEAEAAFRRALDHDPSDPRSRFFLASALAQQGQYKEAADQWRALAESLPADSAWREASAAAVRQAEQAASASPETGTGTPEVLAEPDRSEMIRSMVASLDRRLREAPDDEEGWRRLIRSYLVLGEEANARDALARGRAALGGAGDRAEALGSYAQGLGLSATE